MHKIIVGGLASILATSQVQALRKFEAFGSDSFVPAYYPPPNVTEAPGTSRIAAAVDTRVEIGDGEVIAQDTNARPPAHPQAFTQLFDALERELCTDLGCSPTDEYCVTASTSQQVCISANGMYLPEMRNGFISSVRGIFDRSVTYIGMDSGVIEYGTNLIHILADKGQYSGYGLRVMLENRSTGGGQCGPVVDTIAQGGSLLPEVGSVFGIVGFLCDSIERFRGTATG